jgi:hypothetical protein
MLAKAFNITPYPGCYTANCGAGYPANLFMDIKQAWQGPYLRALWDKGLILGAAPNKFDPDRPITRAELVKLAMDASASK